MAFRFSLASVLRVRESIEKREEVALQKAQLEVARVRQRIDELTEELAKANAAREEALMRPVRANRLHNMADEINAVVEARETLMETLETLKHQRDVQMKLYHSAHGGRQMLSDLFAQQKSAYDQEQAKIQQKTLDDIFGDRLQRSWR